MKRLIPFLFFALATILFTGCDTRFKELQSKTSTPLLLFTDSNNPDFTGGGTGGSGNSLSKGVDSIRYSLKAKSPYTLSMAYKDESNALYAIKITLISGDCDVFLEDGVTPVALGTNITNIPAGAGTQFFKLKIQPKAAVANKFVVDVISKTGNSSSYDFTLVAFGNVPPVASFSITPVAVLTPYQFAFDASKSYDLDVKYGGGISQYKYTVSYNFAGSVITREIYTQNSIIQYAFGNTGNYTILLEVQDNDGAWSTPYTISKNIQ